MSGLLTLPFNLHLPVQATLAKSELTTSVRKQTVPTGQAPTVVSIPWQMTEIVRSAVIPILT